MKEGGGGGVGRRLEGERRTKMRALSTGERNKREDTCDQARGKHKKRKEEIKIQREREREG